MPLGPEQPAPGSPSGSVPESHGMPRQQEIISGVTEWGSGGLPKLSTMAPPSWEGEGKGRWFSFTRPQNRGADPGPGLGDCRAEEEEEDKEPLTGTAVPRRTAPSAACPGGACSCCSPCPQPGCPPPWLGSVPTSRGGTGSTQLECHQPGIPGGPSPISPGHSAPKHPPSTHCACQHLCSSCFPGPSPGKHHRLLLFLPSNNIFPAQNNIGKAVRLLILFQARFSLLPSPSKFLLRLVLCWRRAPSPPKKHHPAMPCPFPSMGDPEEPLPGFASTTMAGREPLEGTAGSSGLRRAGMCSRDLPFSTLGPAAGSQRGRKRVT